MLVGFGRGRQSNLSPFRFLLPLLCLGVVASPQMSSSSELQSSPPTDLSPVTKPGGHCLLDAQCSPTGDVICSQGGRCECIHGTWDGMQCMLDDDAEVNANAVEEQMSGSGEEPFTSERPECSSLEVEKNGKCYVRKKPGENCEFSEQCMNIGDVQYYCIANICQEAPECPPGYVAMGSECLPYSVTGGPCLHPIQCLTGSVCIKGKCRGPCDFNQVFLEESCVDYEGAGCVSISCISNKCPRAFPSCNYITQQKDYLCCDKSMETKVTCPLPNSEPQRDKETGAVVECMHRPCTANYRCVFASYGRGKYICCSVPKAKPRNEGDEIEEEDMDMYGEKSTNRPYVPPPPRPVESTPAPDSWQNWNGGQNWNQWNNNWNGNQNWIGNNNNNNNNWDNNRAWTGNQNQNWLSNYNNAWGRNTWKGWNNYNYGYGYNNNNRNGLAQRRRRIKVHRKGNGANGQMAAFPHAMNMWNSYRRRQQFNSGNRQMRQKPLRRRPYVMQHPGLEILQNVQDDIPETGLITNRAANWSHATRVLVYWCCTNQPCIFKDKLQSFCNKIIDLEVQINRDRQPSVRESQEVDHHEKTNEPSTGHSDAPSFPISVAN